MPCGLAHDPDCPTVCAHLPNDDGTACRDCGLTAEAVDPLDLADELTGLLTAHGAVEMGGEG